MMAEFAVVTHGKYFPNTDPVPVTVLTTEW